MNTNWQIYVCEFRINITTGDRAILEFPRYNDEAAASIAESHLYSA